MHLVHSPGFTPLQTQTIGQPPIGGNYEAGRQLFASVVLGSLHWKQTPGMKHLHWDGQEG
jgi:hypothetical protein